MGQQHSSDDEGQIPDDEMEELKSSTKFNAKELQEYYERFSEDFPDGQITKDNFIDMYCQMYPSGDAKRFAEYVFNAHDIDKDGTVDFKEFMTALSVSRKGTPEERLHWAFNMYDLNGDGFLQRREAAAIISAIFRMRGKSDKQTAEETALKVFIALDKKQDDKLSQEEFITGCLKLGNVIEMIKDCNDNE